jgi:hypothetical protein
VFADIKKALEKPFSAPILIRTLLDIAAKKIMVKSVKIQKNFARAKIYTCYLNMKYSKRTIKFVNITAYLRKY